MSLGLPHDCLRFHNGLRILLNIDAAEFPGPAEDWPRFRDQPHQYFIECDDATAGALWGIITRRTPRLSYVATPENEEWRTSHA
jgi:hypothetical protein